MFGNKLYLYIVACLCLFSFGFGGFIDYHVENDVLLTGSLSSMENNQSDARFKYGGNNFGGLFLLDTPKILSQNKNITLSGTSKSCKQQIKGVYYNNQRGMRFWPLDQETLDILQTITGAYDDLSITGGLFFDCSSTPSNRIYGNITHTVGGYNYELIAGVQLNFGWNTYLSFGGITGLPNFGQTLLFVPSNSGLLLSGHFFDNYGGIAMVQGSGECIDQRYPNPGNICYPQTFTQYSQCGNSQINTGTKSCGGGCTGTGCGVQPDNCCTNGGLPGANDDCIDYSESPYDGTCLPLESHGSAGTFCVYDDEDYINRGRFSDTKDHRGLKYIEIMRLSCLHRGKDTRLGGWAYYPDDYIKKSETLKTLVKIMGIAFNDFSIETEDKTYPYKLIFEDLDKNHWFSRYSEYAFTKGLTNGLYKINKDKKYLNADEYISRNDIVKKLVETFSAIYTRQIPLNEKTNLTDLEKSDPYYYYIRKAETLGFIQGVPQKDGTFKFEGDRFITRAEFAKIVSIPFNVLLFNNIGND